MACHIPFAAVTATAGLALAVCCAAAGAAKMSGRKSTMRFMGDSGEWVDSFNVDSLAPLRSPRASGTIDQKRIDSALRRIEFEVVGLTHHGRLYSPSGCRLGRREVCPVLCDGLPRDESGITLKCEPHYPADADVD